MLLLIVLLSTNYILSTNYKRAKFIYVTYIKNLIIRMCGNYTRNSKLIDAISQMYSRCENLDMKIDHKIYGCLWICHKLVTQRHVEKFPLQLYEIRDIEIRIAEYLEYKLHILE